MRSLPRRLHHNLALSAITCALVLSAGCNSLNRQPKEGLIPVSLRPLGPASFHPLSPVTTKDALKPGPYAFDVSDSGEATWNMPLWAPEGRNGIGPQLSITYASRRSNGLLGKGFTLSGLSTITRCWRTATSDGQYTQYGDTSSGIPVGVPDALCLDGKRLVLHAGHPLELQPENDPGTLIRVTSGTLISPASFAVFHSDGTIWQFGSRDDNSDRSSHATLKGASITVTAVSVDATNGVPNSDAVTEALTGSRSMTWYIDEVLDRWGNFMEIDYDRTTEPSLPGAVEVVPRWIRWTGHHGAPVLYPSRLIEFQYQTGDTRTSYLGGLAILSSQILSHIIVSGPDRLVSDGGSPNNPPKAFRRYDFQYLSDAKGLTPFRLNSITEQIINPDGSFTAKDPIQFTWSDHPRPSFQSPTVLSDITEFPVPSNPFQENQPAAQAEVDEADVWYSVVGDFDGDGRDDLLYRLPRMVQDGVPARTGTNVIGDWFIRMGSPTGLGSRQKVVGIPPTPGGAWAFSARAIDIDSDGQAELLAYHEPVDPSFFVESGYTLYRFTGCNSGNCSFAPQSINEEAVTAITTGFARRGNGMDMGDFNGDGLLDIVQNRVTCQNANPTLCPPVLPVVDFDIPFVRLSAATSQPGQFGTPSFISSAGANLQIDRAEARYIVDIDGNGVPEILTTTYNKVPASGPVSWTAAFLSSLSFAPSGSQALVSPVLLHARPVEQSKVIQPGPTCTLTCQRQDQCVVGGKQIFLTPFTRYFVDINGDGLPDSVAVPSDNADSCPFPTHHGSELYIALNTGGGFRAPERRQQSTHDGFNISLNRDDDRNPIGPPEASLVQLPDGSFVAVSIPGRAVDSGARFVDLDGDGRTDILQLSSHMPEPADNTRGDTSQRNNVVWIRSVEGGFQSYDLTSGTEQTPIPAAPQHYIRSVACDSINDRQCRLQLAGGFGARLSQVGDFNGDGALDIVTLVQNPLLDVDPWARLEQFLGQPVPPDVVTAISGGPLMPAIQVNYRFAGPQSTDGFYAVSTQFDAQGNPVICSSSPCDFGQTYLRKLGWVVHDYSVEAGQFTDPHPIHNVYVFAYETGRVDLRGRGFLGVDKRQRFLTDDTFAQRFERQILTFDHSTRARVFQPSSTQYRYIADDAPQRELLLTPIGSGVFSVLDVHRSSTWSPRAGGFGFNRTLVKTVDERCEILGVPDPRVPHICGRSTMISSIYVQQQYDAYGNRIETRTQSAIGDGSWLDQNGNLRISPTPASLVTVEQSAGTNAADESQWLVNRYPRWVHQSFDPTQQIGQQSLEQEATIDYVQNRFEVQDVTLEPAPSSGPESDSVSGFTLTTAYERDAQLGVLTALNECATVSPCDPTTSRRQSFGFNGNDTDRIFYSSITDALGHVTTIWPHATFGVPYAVDDVNGVRTIFGFDALGRQQYLRRRWGTEERFSYSRDTSNGNPLRSWTMMHSGAAIPQTRATYDPRGLLVNVLQQGFDHDVSRGFVYDRFGRVTSETLPYSGAPPTPLTIEYIRDGLGRITEQSRPGETAVAPRIYSFHTYQGRTTTQTSECVGAPPNCIGGRGATFKVQSDSKGRPVVISTADATGRSVSERISYWHLDLPNQITRPTLPPAQAMTPTAVHPETTVQYDLFGRPTTLTDPDTGQQTYLYNSFGELKQATDADGAVTLFDHDALGRLRHISTAATMDYPTRGDTAGLAQDTVLTYDIGSHAVGQLSSVSSVEGLSRTFLYDLFGRLYQDQLKDEENRTWILAFDYDSLGRLGTVTYPAPRSQPFQIQYDYAGNGQIRNAWKQSGMSKSLLWSQITRNDADQSTSEQFGPVDTVTRKFSDSFNLRSITSAFSGSDVPYQQLQYDWGPDGLVTSRRDIGFHLSESYQHDFLGRLTDWTVTQECRVAAVIPVWRSCKSTEWHYDYDDWGDIRTRSVVSGTSFPATNYEYTTTSDSSRPHAVKQATTGAKVDTFKYDDAGQMLSGHGNTYHWTPLGLPFRVESAAANRQSTYLYDGLGQRAVERQSALGSDNIDKRIVTFNGLFEYRTNTAPGAIPEQYVYNVFGNDGPVAQVRRTAQPGINSLIENNYFVHPDQLGNPDTITSFLFNLTIPGGSPSYTGKVVERSKYEPFGERRAPETLAQPGTVPDSPDASLGFTGQQPDDTFGLVNFVGRVYEPGLGHFVSPDPILNPSFSEGLNRYSYVLNSPVEVTDPTGFEEDDEQVFFSAEMITVALPSDCVGECVFEKGESFERSSAKTGGSVPTPAPSTADENSPDTSFAPVTTPSTPQPKPTAANDNRPVNPQWFMGGQPWKQPWTPFANPVVNSFRVDTPLKEYILSPSLDPTKPQDPLEGMVAPQEKSFSNSRHIMLTDQEQSRFREHYQNMYRLVNLEPLKDLPSGVRRVLSLEQVRLPILSPDQRSFIAGFLTNTALDNALKLYPTALEQFNAVTTPRGQAFPIPPLPAITLPDIK